QQSGDGNNDNTNDNTNKQVSDPGTGQQSNGGDNEKQDLGPVLAFSSILHDHILAKQPFPRCYPLCSKFDNLIFQKDSNKTNMFIGPNRSVPEKSNSNSYILHKGKDYNHHVLNLVLRDGNYYSSNYPVPNLQMQLESNYFTLDKNSSVVWFNLDVGIT